MFLALFFKMMFWVFFVGSGGGAMLKHANSFEARKICKWISRNGLSRRNCGQPFHKFARSKLCISTMSNFGYEV
jgi:hypothetical protein